MGGTMKISLQFLIALITFSLASLAQADAIAGAEINISCQCSYYVDGLERTILVAGSSEVKESDLNNCRLDQGRVVNPENGTACFKAKMNASWNCMQQARDEIDPGMMRFPSVLLDQNSCYGEINLADETIRHNLP